MPSFRQRRGSNSTALVLIAGQRGAAPKPSTRSLPDIYLSEHGGPRLVSRMKWLLSTCIVGAFGFCIIAAVMYASMNMDDGSGLIGSMQRASVEALRPKEPTSVVTEAALMPRGQKTDQTRVSTKGVTTRYVIHDTVVERRLSREFIKVRPYVRVVASLGTDRSDVDAAIPPLNPLELYESTEPVVETLSSALRDTGNEQIVSRLLEMPSDGLTQDAQRLSVEDIERQIAEADATYAESEANLKPVGGGDDSLAEFNFDDATPVAAVDEASGGTPLVLALPPRTTVIEKALDEAGDGEVSEVLALPAKNGDTVAGLTKEAGVEPWQATAIQEAMATLPAGRKLRAGQELRFTLVPQALDPTKKDPIRVLLVSNSQPEILVKRGADGSYTAQRFSAAAALDIEAFGLGDEVAERNTLYTGIYQAALTQRLSPAAISRLLRVNSYDHDFKSNVRSGDRFDLFFETRDGEASADNLGELLFAAVNAGGVDTRYYRFRTPDGAVDYYNPDGSNSRKFLMRQPVRAGRFTSGFGFRRHPLLGINKMHTGVDWAAPVGTAILAAGNGVIEEAGRLGGYGNYVRIRHGNGYKTTYGHMSRFGEGIRKGTRVRQGQVIGFVGSTGLSSGPHLHYEVLVNNRYVNPASIKVPRGRQLSGRLLADFKREQQRIDDLMVRTPVQTRVANISE